MFVEKVGISEMDTIVAATSNGAKVLRVYDKTGSLEAGKSADLLSTYGSVYTFAWGQFVAGILMNIIRCQIWKFTMPTTGVIDTPLVLVLAYQLIFGTMISYCIYLRRRDDDRTVQSEYALFHRACCHRSPRGCAACSSAGVHGLCRRCAHHHLHPRPCDTHQGETCTCSGSADGQLSGIPPIIFTP